MKVKSNGTEDWTFYGAHGEKLGVYTGVTSMCGTTYYALTQTSWSVWFAGKPRRVARNACLPWSWGRNSFLIVAVAGLMATILCHAQDDNSAAHLIASITQPPYSDRFLGCGPEARYRQLATGLAGLGTSALPDLQNAMYSIRHEGVRSPYATNAGWLLLAYTRIRGEAAFPEIRQMLIQPKLDFLRFHLDRAAALSAGLTDYISVGHQPDDEVCRAQQPRDSLNRLISAWLGRDRRSVETILNSDARTELLSAIHKGTWQSFTAEIWHGRPDKAAAVGYRFRISGRWSEPDEPLVKNRQTIGDEGASAAPEIGVDFVDRSGRDCGTTTIRFIRSDIDGTYASRYFVGNGNIVRLLRIVTGCATRR
jgi:hypothetical protein